MDTRRQGRPSEWTAEKVSNLRKLWLSGVKTSEVARALKMSRNAVIGKLRRIGLGNLRGSPIKGAKPARSGASGYIKQGRAQTLWRERHPRRSESEARWQRLAKRFAPFEDADIPEYDGRRLRLSPPSTRIIVLPPQFRVELSDSSETLGS